MPFGYAVFLRSRTVCWKGLALTARGAAPGPFLYRGFEQTKWPQRYLMAAFRSTVCLFNLPYAGFSRLRGPITFSFPNTPSPELGFSKGYAKAYATGTVRMSFPMNRSIDQFSWID